MYFLIELSWLKSVHDSPIAPYCFPISLIMSGMFLSVSLMANHHFNVFQWHLFGGLRGILAQCYIIEQLNIFKQSIAQSPLSNLVPSLIVFTELLVSLIPLIGKFPYHPSGACHHLPFYLELVFQPFNNHSNPVS